MSRQKKKHYNKNLKCPRCNGDIEKVNIGWSKKNTKQPYFYCDKDDVFIVMELKIVELKK